ncbi:MAG TPA: glycosyltransferase family 4 protein [Thermoleophilaceae bacterium]
MSGGRPAKLLAYTDSGAFGGAEIALGYLLAALPGEYEVAVLATSPEVGDAIAAYRAGASVHTVAAPRGAADQAALLEHTRAVRRLRPAILHANQAWPWACGYGELAGLFTPGVRVLAVDHLPAPGDIPRPRRLGRRLLARRLHAHVAVGERVARLVEELVGLPGGSVAGIPNGVPLPPAGGEPDPPIPKADAVTIGSLGRLTTQKGYDLLVRALPELPGARALLVGDGPERNALEALARDLGVAERLQITGWVDDARRYLGGFDVFALPSRWEGMPLGILEAMHAGLPVVSTAVGSVAEAIADGQTGYVVPPDDVAKLAERLSALVADAELRRSMGESAKRVAGERFTDTAMAQRYEAVYRRLLGA